MSRMAAAEAAGRFIEGHFTPSVGSTSGSHSCRGRGIAVRSVEAATLAESGGARPIASFTASARADGALLRVLIGACAVQGFPEEAAAADSSWWFIEWHFTPSIGSSGSSAEAAPLESGGARCAASSTASARTDGVPLWVLVGACAAQGPPEELVMADGGGWTPTATPASSARSAELSAARAPMTASTRNSSRGRVAIVALERGGRIPSGTRVVAFALQL